MFMPESDSSEESLRLGEILAESLGITAILEDISPILSASGCYRRRDEAIRRSVPDFGDGWKSKLMMADLNSGARYARRPLRDGCLPPDAFLPHLAANSC